MNEADLLWVSEVDFTGKNFTAQRAADFTAAAHQWCHKNLQLFPRMKIDLMTITHPMGLHDSAKPADKQLQPLADALRQTHFRRVGKTGYVCCHTGNPACQDVAEVDPPQPTDLHGAAFEEESDTEEGCLKCEDLFVPTDDTPRCLGCAMPWCPRCQYCQRSCRMCARPCCRDCKDDHELECNEDNSEDSEDW